MSAPTIIGVDPGKTGALAALDVGTGALVSVLDMPMLDAGIVDGWAVRNWVLDLADLDEIRAAWVERVHSMPKQGVASSFTFGAAYGGVATALNALSIPVELVPPNVWKKAASLGKDKGAARAMACRLWPSSSEWFRRVKDDGRAEAALIARHGWRLVREVEGR